MERYVVVGSGFAAFVVATPGAAADVTPSHPKNHLNKLTSTNLKSWIVKLGSYFSSAASFSW